VTGREEYAPDLVIAGAARSGTSFLSATLATHPSVDAGSLKEPNYFSSRWHQGSEWYDSLFQPRTAGSVRVDASVSYTYPQHPLALERVREANPDVQVVYTVREPRARLVSHYHLFRYYYDREDWGTLGEALDYTSMLLGAGDYQHWLSRLRDVFPLENVLVVPFPATTGGVSETARLLLSRVGLEQREDVLQAPSFRNEVRDFRVPGVKALHRRMQMTRVYPKVRSLVGADRLRRWRQAMTKPTELPSMESEMATLSADQLTMLRDHAAHATSAVEDWLREQDDRLGMDWSSVWARHAMPAEAD
jgi:Sulfotransferase domain